jgi:mycofactocin precursor
MDNEPVTENVVELHDDVEEELLIEEISIDGMCGVY